ncbi:MAG TPA: hypothetical protein PLS49_00685 [Candidatus Woesebacteria bacterium]|nr:hypothetical protein [Candidatus Woesebacteria bacterium]
MSPEGQFLQRPDIEQILPHRRPFMFLESAEIIESGKLAIGQLADLTHPDFIFLKGHFPSFQVVPGAILMETLAELAGIALASGNTDQDQKIGFLVKDAMRYRQMVRPGDLIELKAEILSFRHNLAISKVQAFKEGKIATEGEIEFSLVDISNWEK